VRRIRSLHPGLYTVAEVVARVWHRSGQFIPGDDVPFRGLLWIRLLSRLDM
jgi:hypothetical protein